MNFKKMLKRNSAPNENMSQDPRFVNKYQAVHDDFRFQQVQSTQRQFGNLLIDLSMSQPQQHGSASNLDRGGHNSATLDRKVPMFNTQKSLPSHSHLSLVKRAIQGAEDGTAYNKAIYHEKRVLETMEKYILARSEAASSWSAYMRDESNHAIRDLYQRLCQLDTLWVQQQNNHRSEVQEQRKLFQLLMLGEQNLLQQQKRADTAANRVKKLQKQMDDTLAKSRSSKGNIDLRKLEQIQRDLERAVSINEQVQSEFQSQTSNNQIFRYNKIKKMLMQLCEAEVQLYQESWRIAEVKLQLVKIHMGRAHSKITAESVRNANAESAQAVRNLYNDLGLPPPTDCNQDWAPQPATRYPMESKQQPTTGRPNQQQGDRQVPNQRMMLPIPHPSAPTADLISLRSIGSGSMRSDGSSDAEMDACYNPIPDIDLSDTEASNDNRVDEYIYEFDEAEFDDETYQNVQEATGRDYLQLQNDDDDTPDTHTGTPFRPPRRPLQPPIGDEEIYEDTDALPEPDFDPPSASSQDRYGDDSEEIFGTISDLQRSSRPNLYPSLNDSSNTEGNRGSYGEIWQARTGDTQPQRRNVPLPARPPPQVSSDGVSRSDSRNDSGFGSNPASRSGSGTRDAQPSTPAGRGLRTSGEEPRYVSGTGRGKPAVQLERPNTSSQQQELESELQTLFKKKFKEFKDRRSIERDDEAQQQQQQQQQQQDQQTYDVPPPLPRKVGRSFLNNP